MRDLITIGELAKLLKISTSKIRFYEKMGLVKPSRHDESGYRLFGFKEIEILQFINLLRELNVPIHELQKISDSDIKYDFKKILTQSREKIKHQIEHLEKIEAIIEKKLRGLLDFEKGQIETVELPARTIYLPFKENENISETPKEIYDFVSENDIDYSDPNHDIYNILTPDGNRMFGIFNKTQPEPFKVFETITLPSGKYVRGLFPVATKEDSKKCFETLEQHARSQNLIPTGYKIIVEFFEILAYSVDEYIMKFEILVAEK